jgi:hypothetical protein
VAVNHPVDAGNANQTAHLGLVGGEPRGDLLVDVGDVGLGRLDPRQLDRRFERPQ